MAAAINAMANELNLLRRGSFYQPTVSRFDVNNPNESLENLNQRLAATFADLPKWSACQWDMCHLDPCESGSSQNLKKRYNDWDE